MKVSFCITCKNRLHQISKTLKENLEDNIELQNYIEFVLVDFDSQDGLKEWIIENFKKELTSGYLKYFFTKELKYWDMSVTKNTAHLLATGDILVNLDCDNYTGLRGGSFVMNQFDIYGPKLLLHQTSSNPADGSHGRISMLKSYFHLIGGYDESFNPMGYQDVDLIQRLVRIGLIYMPKCYLQYNKTIPNTKQESVQYVDSTKSYITMCSENMTLSMQNINNGKILSNNGTWGIRHNIFQFTNGKFIKIM